MSDYYIEAPCTNCEGVLKLFEERSNWMYTYFIGTCTLCGHTQRIAKARRVKVRGDWL